MRRLKREKPVYFVVVHDDANPVEPRSSNEDLERVPELQAWLDENYVSDRREGKLELFRRSRHDANDGEW